jgi:probable phosphoglycerate mutase
VARLVLIRHAPTPETGKKLTGRLPGVGLDAPGREAAEATAAALAGLPLSVVYTSPLMRCRETARIVAAPHGLRPIPYRSLIEVDYGTWSGRSLGSLRRTKAWRSLLWAPSRFRFPGGERLGEVAARSAAACEDLAAAHPDGTIAVVSHGDVIKSALASFLGVPADLYHRIVIDPASWSIVDLPAHGMPMVVAVNRVAGREAAR